MIVYEPSHWWRVLFSFGGTVLPRVLGRVGLLTGLCLALCLLDEHVLQPARCPLPPLDQLGHTVLGVALGMLIVFRTNSAYQRYWEGRSHWGALINASRNLARGGAAFAGPADDLARLLAAYALAVKQKVRDTRDFAELRPLVSGRVYEQLSKANDPPALLTRGLSDWINSRLREGRLHPQQAAQLEALVCALVDQQGGCEKIRKTPLPFVYAALIKQILFVYLLSLPFVLVAKMGYAAPLVVAVVALGMLGIEEAGVEIENPFDLDANNLPLESLCATIARDAREATAPEA
jgi:ion channel-forming bestrophin family protein